MRNFSILMLFVLLLSACNTQKKLKAAEQDYMEGAYVDIKRNIPEGDITILNDTIKVLFPEHLLFKVGEAQVIEENYLLLERLAGSLNKFKKSSILITGYSDTSGDEEVNEVLSENRALNVKKVLEKYEVNSQRMYTWGRGKKDPIATNKTEEGRRRNRRVEFVILYKYKH